MDRTAIDDLKERVDLVELARRDTWLHQVARAHGGELAGPCPFCGGQDRFRVQPGRGRWLCRGCTHGKWKDAVEYAMRRENVGFVEAYRLLGGEFKDHPRLVTHAAVDVEELATPEWRAVAARNCEEAEALLWTERGAAAREWLHTRGLKDETIRRFRLGYVDEQSRSFACGQGERARAVVIPWWLSGEVWRVKLRRLHPRDENDRYTSVADGYGVLYGADGLADHSTALLTEGEFDCMLAWQEAGDLLSVASLGSATATPSRRAIDYLVSVSKLLVCYDADAAGDRGADKLRRLSARIRRVTVPTGKDLTEFHRAGGNIRQWIAMLSSQALSVRREPDALSFLHGHRCRLCGEEMQPPDGPRPYDRNLYLLWCPCGNEQFERRPGTVPALPGGWAIVKDDEHAASCNLLPSCN